MNSVVVAQVRRFDVGSWRVYGGERDQPWRVYYKHSLLSLRGKSVVP